MVRLKLRLKSPQEDTPITAIVPSFTPINRTPSADTPATPSVQRRITSSEAFSTPSSSGCKPQALWLTSSDHGLSTCMADETLFTKVTVHTAKCTECDKRNMEIMRRCPGCTFQVCKPCCDRREQDGRGLMHGNAMTTSPSPTVRRTVRKKPPGTTLVTVVKSIEVEIKPENIESASTSIVPSDSVISQTLSLTPSPPSKKKRQATSSKRRILSSTLEELTEDDDFSPASSTPTKRSRKAKTFPVYKEDTTDITSELDSTIRTPTSTPTPPKYPWEANTSPTRKIASPHLTATAESPPSSPVNLHDLSINELLQHYGVNTSEHPYQEHLLARREPFMFNPVIRVPDVIQRSGVARPSAGEIRQSIREKVEKKLRPKMVERMDECLESNAGICSERVDEEEPFEKIKACRGSESS